MSKVINFVRVISVCVIIYASAFSIRYIYKEYEAIKLNLALTQLHEQALSVETSISEKIIENDKPTPVETTVSETIADIQEPELIIETEIKLEPELLQPLIVTQTMTAFLDLNEDTAGWLKINNTKIDNVVVQTSDNDFYLDHNFEKNSSQPGTLFIDFRCNINDYVENQTKNIIIYGHKQKSGSMFGTLHNYHNNIDFYKENPTFEFSNLYETYTYKVLAMFVCQTKGEDVFDYHNYINLPEKGDYCFYKWLLNVRDRSEIETPVSADINDYYITLSTCSYEKPDCRFVVIGRRVRDDETNDVDTEKAYSRSVSIR